MRDYGEKAWEGRETCQGAMHSETLMKDEENGG